MIKNISGVNKKYLAVAVGLLSVLIILPLVMMADSRSSGGGGCPTPPPGMSDNDCDGFNTCNSSNCLENPYDDDWDDNDSNTGSICSEMQDC